MHIIVMVIGSWHMNQKVRDIHKNEIGHDVSFFEDVFPYRFDKGPRSSK